MFLTSLGAMSDDRDTRSWPPPARSVALVAVAAEVLVAAAAEVLSPSTAAVYVRMTAEMSGGELYCTITEPLGASTCSTFPQEGSNAYVRAVFAVSDWRMGGARTGAWTT